MCWPGGVLRISGDGDDRTGAKIKTQKIPLGFKQNPRKYLDQKLNWPQKDPLPNFRRITRLGYTGTTTNLQCFEHPKYICQIFLPQKTRNLKVQTQRTPCIIRVNWNPEYPPPPSPFHWTLRYTLLYSCSNLAAISCRCLLVRAPRIAIIASSSLPVIDRKRKKQRQRARIFK